MNVDVPRYEQYICISLLLVPHLHNFCLIPEHTERQAAYFSIRLTVSERMRIAVRSAQYQKCITTPTSSHFPSRQTVHSSPSNKVHSSSVYFTQSPKKHKHSQQWLHSMSQCTSTPQPTSLTSAAPSKSTACAQRQESLSSTSKHLATMSASPPRVVP